MLQHNVYFYLKPELSAHEKNKFVEGLKSLLTIDELVEGFIGTPGGTSVRPVIDNTYDYALSTVFKSVEQHDIYQEHPVHQAFVNSCKGFWTLVKVYDVEIL